MYIQALICQLEKYIISRIVDAPIVILIIYSSQNPGGNNHNYSAFVLCYEFLYYISCICKSTHIVGLVLKNCILLYMYVCNF